MLRQENSPSLETLEKLAKGLRSTPEWLAYGLGQESTDEDWVPAEEPAAPSPTAALSEDAVRYEPPASGGEDRLSAALLALTRDRPHVWVYRLHASVLELAGIRAGDLLVVERRENYRSGDIVCVNAAYSDSEFETLFRIYQHPFIVPAYADPFANRPRLLDDEGTFAIYGVVTEVVRSAGV